MAKELKELTKRADNYSQWYNDLITKADLAERLLHNREKDICKIQFLSTPSAP